MKTTLTFCAGLACIGLGCAPGLTTQDDGEHSDASQAIDAGVGVRRAQLDATDDGRYRRFDLDEGEEVDGGDKAWDLAFSRFRVMSNGGDSGSGGVVVARLWGADFGGLEVAPSDGYVEDHAETAPGSEGGDPDFAFLGERPWYEYDGDTHMLSPADVVYVVRSTERRYYAVRMLSYYDDAGTSGIVTFEWAALEPPDGEVSMVADGEGRDGGSAPAPADPQAGAGCYDPMAHSCECDVPAQTCAARDGVWTDRCDCAAEEQPNGGGTNHETADAGQGDMAGNDAGPTDAGPADTDMGAGDAGMGDAGSAPAPDAGVTAGCYDPATHRCECNTTAMACSEALGVWSDQCAC